MAIHTTLLILKIPYCVPSQLLKRVLRQEPEETKFLRHSDSSCLKNEFIETTGSRIVHNPIPDSFLSQENGNQVTNSNENPCDGTPEMLVRYLNEPAVANIFITDVSENNADIASKIDETRIISRGSFVGVFHTKLS